MGRNSTALRWIRPAGLWLALAAMVLRLTMPPGWMPGPALTDGIPVVMCTMDGPVKMTLPIDGAPKPDPAKTSHNECPFGAAPHVATAVPLVLQSAPVGVSFGKSTLPRQIRMAVRRPNTPQSPRGPPLAV